MTQQALPTPPETPRSGASLCSPLAALSSSAALASLSFPLFSAMSSLFLLLAPGAPALAAPAADSDYVAATAKPQPEGAIADVDLPLVAADVPTLDPARDAEYRRMAPKSIVELQRWRVDTRLDLVGADGRAGYARLTDLQPSVGRAFLLEIGWTGRAPAVVHLEARVGSTLTLDEGSDGPVLLVTSADAEPVRCDVFADGAAELLAARSNGRAYTAFCDGRVVVRGAVDGRKTSTEWTTDFLRDYVPQGEAITDFVKDTFFKDRWLKIGELVKGGGDVEEEARSGPEPAAVDPSVAGSLLVLEDFGLKLSGAPADGLEVGQWYPVSDQPGVWAGALKPSLVAPEVAARTADRVNPLDTVERDALMYAVAFDLSQFNLDYTLGTEHPRLEWSERAADWIREKYPDMPGPDGFADGAPLMRTGQVDPAAAPDLVATFTAGFKRLHGGFKTGKLGRENLASHYGFVEDGVVWSKLQPGLATVVGWTDGSVEMLTWTDELDAQSPRIRFARQNGVPLLEVDATTGEVAPHALVKEWAGGNWASSPDARLRSLRAAGCMLDEGDDHYLVYAWFSSATPSAMATTLSAWGCDYAMLLDMNALEHTYMAMYEPIEGGLVPNHLVNGMNVLDRVEDDVVMPRFVAFADNRDFFTLTRKK